jgi:hypothetical protein
MKLKYFWKEKRTIEPLGDYFERVIDRHWSFGKISYLRYKEGVVINESNYKDIIKQSKELHISLTWQDFAEFFVK